MTTLRTAMVAGSLLAATAMAQSLRYTVVDLGNVGPNGQPFTTAGTAWS